ncbi:MAG: hypothetical protein GEU88_05080 [Solirubrobacterales bacterium]|nr:hypothetical protein [Solirubrobacterales bacterium]
MPTTRPRHTLTETESVAEALARARRRWPGERDSALLRRLALLGAERLAGDAEADAERRREAIRRYRGALAGAYGRGYLGRLRGEWPE